MTPRYNYVHSEYMTPAEDHSVEEFVDNCEYARFLHFADIFRFKMDELEAAGALTPSMSITCLRALQDCQYSRTFVRVMHISDLLDIELAKLPA